MVGKIEEIFNGCGAILKGHFVLASLKHSGTYLEKAILYKNPIIFEEMCRMMAQEVSLRFNNIEVVIGPAPVGSVLAQRVAFHLGENYQRMVVPLFTEKGERGEHLFRRGFGKDMAGKNVLVVDDVMTSGDTITQIIKTIITSFKGKMIAAAVICDRGEVALDNLYSMFPVISLSRLKPQVWLEADCTLCKEMVPIDANIGRGGEFLKSHPSYILRDNPIQNK